MGLLPKPPGRISGGTVRFEGRDLATLAPDEMRDLRGNRMAMIFQEPMTSLNPAFTIGDQIVEGIRVHRDVSAEAGARRTRSRCCGGCASRRPSSASTSIRTSCRAACASA